MATAAEVKIERSKLDQLCLNSIRMVAADAVQKANNGHPGMPMGMAAAAYAPLSWYRWVGLDGEVVEIGRAHV